MANFTQCSFAIPYTITAATQIRVTFNDSAQGAVTRTASAVPGTYYLTTDQTVSAGTDSLLGHLLYQLEQAEAVLPATLGTYSISEISSTPNYRGRMLILRAQGDPVDSVASIEILGGEITLETFGRLSDPWAPLSAPGNPAIFISTNRGIGHWILDDVSLMASTQETPRTIAAAVSSPDGTTSRDVWGTVTRKQLELLTLPGAAVYTHYVDDADFAAVIGCATGDHSASFDDLRSRWAELPDTASVRFTPDIDNAGTYQQLVAGAEDAWITALDGAAQIISDGPLFFDLSIEAYKVS